jgi:hypothetical protein
MADTTTVTAMPYPEGADANDVPADMQALAERIDEVPGIESLTSAQIAALSAGQKPAGRVVYNSTTSKLQVSNGTSFANIDAAALLLAGGTLSGALAMGSNKITGLAAGTTAGDAVRYEQALLLAGGTMAGNIAMGSNKVTGLAAATTNGDAVRYEQALLLAGGTMSGAIAMGGNKVTGLAAATTNGDAVRYEQALLLAGGTMSGAIAMGGNKVTGLAAASANGDAVRYEQLTAKLDSARVVSGVWSGTTDASGDATITLPTSPTGNWAVTLTAKPDSDSDWSMVTVKATTATSVTFRLWRWSTVAPQAAYSSSSYDVHYIAVAY